MDKTIAITDKIWRFGLGNCCIAVGVACTFMGLKTFRSIFFSRKIKSPDAKSKD